MADAAAFFANKKKKKKAFKFNANNIDAATVEKKIHVDAPALSTNDAVPTTAPPTAEETNIAPETNEEWDEDAMVATAQKKAVHTSAELLDMKALDLKRSEQGDIQEKLRVEETKAQLAAAREGMEREAQRLKEQKEEKAAAAAAAAQPGDAWRPSYRRPGLASMMRGGLPTKPLDTESEELFPDLAAADAILEKQKQASAKAPKKTPVGGGATWASRPVLNLKKPENRTPVEPAPAAQASKPAEEKAPEPVPATKPEVKATTESAAPAPEGAAPAKAPIKPKKKKKKDLSTFKPSS
eukprot:Nitzschia sp. Nitz4//scaffold51_size120721//102774//103746//NITZ4_003745-RA/size120721-snap-gene-0.25-mRNA-1//1//CDS//3329553916//3450//frame0